MLCKVLPGMHNHVKDYFLGSEVVHGVGKNEMKEKEINRYIRQWFAVASSVRESKDMDDGRVPTGSSTAMAVSS
jgi:hypothetical protein